MTYISSAQATEKCGITERIVKNYCNKGRVEGAYISGKTWHIPVNTENRNLGQSERLVCGRRIQAFSEQGRRRTDYYPKNSLLIRRREIVCLPI